MNRITEQEHTKGPWHRFGGMVDGYGIASLDSVIIAQDAFNGLHNDANAKLIAAAPELLEVAGTALELCENLLDYYNDKWWHRDSIGELCHQLRLAITKAEGDK